MILYIFLLLIIAAIAYGFGSLSTLVLASNFVFRGRLLKLGKGNVWLSNFRRVYGIRGFLGILLVEFIKDAIPIIIGGLILSLKGHADVGRAFAGFCLVMGRLYPIFYNLKGSHASLAMIFAGAFVSIPIGIVGAVFVLLVTVVTKYVALGTIIGAIAMIAVAVLTVDVNLTVILVAITCGMAVLRHIPSVAAILNGREDKISFEKDLSYKFDEKL